MKIAGILKAAVPTLATALTSPAGGLVAKMVVDKLDIAKDSPIEAVIDAVTDMAGDPEQIAKLKEIENETMIRLREMDMEAYALDVEDRKDARKLASDWGKWPYFLLGIFLFTMFVLAFIALMLWDIPDENEPIIHMMIGGVIVGGVERFLNFTLGSSRGSKEKTEIMKNGGK